MARTTQFIFGDQSARSAEPKKVRLFLPLLTKLLILTGTTALSRYAKAVPLMHWSLNLFVV